MRERIKKNKGMEPPTTSGSIPGLRKLKGGLDFCELEASLGYKVSFRLARAAE